MSFKDKEPAVRTFIAIEMPDGVKAAVKDIQAELIKTRADVAWTSPEGLHLTLKFLGDVQASRIEELTAAVASAIEGVGAIELGVSGIGVFPNQRAPRVVWLGLSGELDKLRTLNEKIEDACTRLGYKREDRPFKPHLTLGRVKSPGGQARLTKILAMLEHVTTEGFTADRVSIIRSDLNPDGAIYTELARLGL